MSKRYLFLYVSILSVFLMQLLVLTLKSTNSEGWLGFWGNVIGGIIGAFTSVLVLRMEFNRRDEEKKREFTVGYNALVAAIWKGYEKIDTITNIEKLEKDRVKQDLEGSYEILSQALKENKKAILLRSQYVHDTFDDLIERAKLLATRAEFVEEDNWLSFQEEIRDHQDKMLASIRKFGEALY